MNESNYWYYRIVERFNQYTDKKSCCRSVNQFDPSFAFHSLEVYIMENSKNIGTYNFGT